MHTARQEYTFFRCTWVEWGLCKKIDNTVEIKANNVKRSYVDMHLVDSTLDRLLTFGII